MSSGSIGRETREGKTKLSENIRNVQTMLREGIGGEPVCGAVFDGTDGEERMCLRDPGHPLPHGEEVAGPDSVERAIAEAFLFQPWVETVPAAQLREAIETAARLLRERGLVA